MTLQDSFHIISSSSLESKMNTSKMSAVNECSALELAAYHLAIYTKFVSKSELVTQISNFLHEHYRIGSPCKPNPPVRANSPSLHHLAWFCCKDKQAYASWFHISVILSIYKTIFSHVIIKESVFQSISLYFPVPY